MGVEYEKIDSGTKIDMHRKQTEMIKQYEQKNGKLMEMTAIQIIQLIDLVLKLIKKRTGKIV